MRGFNGCIVVAAMSLGITTTAWAQGCGTPGIEFFDTEPLFDDQIVLLPQGCDFIQGTTTLTGMSPDGSIIVGQATGFASCPTGAPNLDPVPFRWTTEGGLEPLLDLSGDAMPRAVNNDGIIVGDVPPDPPNVAFVYDGSTVEYLPDNGGGASANGISEYSPYAIVGDDHDADEFGHREPVIWELAPSGTLTKLNRISSPLTNESTFKDIDADGSRAVVQSLFGQYAAAVDHPRDPEHPSYDLYALHPGSEIYDHKVEDITTNGEWAAGYTTYTESTPAVAAVLWDLESSPPVEFELPRTGQAKALGVADEGNVVVGSGGHPVYGTQTALIWLEQADGSWQHFSMQEYLQTEVFGAPIDDRELSEVLAVSADGNTWIGTAADLNGPTIFAWRATHGGAGGPDDEVPTISCPANLTVSNDAGQCGAIVDLDDPIAEDNCPDVSVSCSHDDGFFEVGETTVTCTATDVGGNASDCQFVVTVMDDEPPVITCPDDQSEDNDLGDCAAVVTFDADAVAEDNCAVDSVACSPESGALYPVGTTEVTCTADDGNGNIADCGFEITVGDLEDPLVDLAVSQTELWPADHRYDSVDVSAFATDNCEIDGAVTIQSNEPDDGSGDGAFTGDVDGFDAYTSPYTLLEIGESATVTGGIIVTQQVQVDLRAERDGAAKGRVYTITVEAMDDAGNSDGYTTLVTVPHDRAE